MYGLLLLSFLSGCKPQAGFLHTEGGKIIDGKGNEVILRGMGFGGWMLQEGYMLQTASFAGPQHAIRQSIADLVGEEATETFYKAWRKNYCTRDDIDRMASWGFNSLRLPMHYNLFTLPIEEEPVAGKDTWLDTGFTMVDSLLEWCAANQVYLILDLHAAPGGQGKDANISDYDESKPSLWESEENQRKTIALWRTLAQRYAREPWIGGYDLINEPNWDFDQAGNKNGCDCTENELLWSFYEKLIRSVREVDPNHIIMIEGNCWGNNYKGVPDIRSFGENIVISFHKYWNFNNLESIQWVLDMREQYQVPVWLGESGENSNTWFTNAIALVEQNGIGWAWWPFKKIGSVTGTITIPKTEGWEKLLQYWRGNVPRPDTLQAVAWLMEQAEQMKLENCIIHYDVIDAMFRQAQGDKTPRPFAANEVPGTLLATDYDLGAHGFAYFDTDTANYRVSTQRHLAWNRGHSYRNDGVDIGEQNGECPSFFVGWTEDGEWLHYTLNAREGCNSMVTVTYSAPEAGSMLLMETGNGDSLSLALPPTGSFETRAEIPVGAIALQQGQNTLKVVIVKGGMNLYAFNLKPLD